MKPAVDDGAILIFGRFVEEARAAASTDNVCVHLLSSDRTRLVCQAVSSGYRATRLAHGLDVSAALGAQAALRDGQTVRIDDATSDVRVARVARERYGLRACLYVPFAIGGEVAGVAIFSYQRPHHWTDAEVGEAERLVRDLASRLPTTPALRAGPSFEGPLVRLYDAMQVQLWLLDRTLLSRWSNESALPDDSARRDELVGPRAPHRRISVAALLGSPSRGAELVGAIRSIFAGDLRQFEALVNAEDAWWRVTIIATADASKEQEEVAVAVLDVTDTALAQRAIESARNTVALGRISANVAHEMNNILQLVLALLEDVRQAEDVSTLGQFASDVERTVQRGVSLTRQLLSFSSPERGSVVAFDLAAALTEWWPLLRQSVGASRHARLSAGTELRVVASRREVELALFNIMGNSRDASAPGSWITVALEEAGDFARLDVVDQGSGMSPEVLRRATEPFFTTKGAQSGTGLGLATVRQVVEQVGGKLAIASTAGQGTTVSMYLPRERGVGGFPSVRPASALREGRRVLYLEDDALLGDVLKHQLSVRGMTVRRYSSVSVALAALRDEPSWATAVLADIALDDGTGLDVAEAVATARPDVRVVIYSGQVDPHERARIEQRGWTLLEKPVNVTAICEALQNG